MRILFLLTRALAGTGAALRRELLREHAVEVIDLRGETDYDRVVDAIDAADRVISW
jgi:hypothetical protein